MRLIDYYYWAKPFIPRRLQIFIRTVLATYKRKANKDVWPIYEAAAKTPEGWIGWPDQKRFALILSHDVDRAKGHDQSKRLMDLEARLGFRSAFNFVPEAYRVSPALRLELAEAGFEVGVHGLTHDGKLYSSREMFDASAPRINHYLKEWGAVGFNSPSMHHNLDWIGELEIEYDRSTFDTDPFEPQSDGMGTIFPFWVANGSKTHGYVELPYTMPQDHCLFIILKEIDNKIWKEKLAWIAEKGGMAYLNTHPDYMKFDGNKCSVEEYPSDFYQSFLEYIKADYANQYWHALPREMARFWREKMVQNNICELASG
jgi:peptidoglycan/xylan/chitin deacetylase (PgdA/CDA1 family)